MSGSRSLAFGRKVASKRQEARLNQGQLGEKVGLDQQSISRLETRGVIPDDDTVKMICEVLKIDEIEAGRLIRCESQAEQEAERYRRHFLKEMDSWVSASKNPSDLIRIFLILEDHLDWSAAAVSDYFELLSRSEYLELFILFRFGAESIGQAWKSFPLLMERLSRRWEKAGLDTKLLDRKLKGFYPKTDQGESGGHYLPLSHPVIVVAGSSNDTYYSCFHDRNLYHQLRGRGVERDLARQMSLRLIKGDSRRAGYFTFWIGTEMVCGHDSTKWVKI